MTGTRLRLVPTMLLVAVIATAASAAGIGVRATFGAHVAVDEVQYLLSALSVAEDGDLDIADEWSERRWTAFADSEPPVQTEVLTGGREISPHDPLLPVLLAVPMGLGGWVAAKLLLALLAGLLAAVTLWVAVRRFLVPLPLAAVGVGIAAATAPLAVYGQQVYPELPAALAVVVAAGSLAVPRFRVRDLVLLAVAVTALPWLSVKYVPVAAVLAGLGGYRCWRASLRGAAASLGLGLAAMGAVYLGIHRLVWGGWTVYASGDHFQESGEFGVVGFHPDFGGRALRLVGLLVDRTYGLVPWQPAWLLVIPALAAALYGRRWHTAVLGLPLVAGWLVATFVAVTMNGYWWPGRQLVVVLPLALLVILRWLAGCEPTVRRVAAGLGLLGVLAYGCLLVDGYAHEITWVSGFDRVDDPGYAALRPFLPDYAGQFWLLHVAWIGVFALLAFAGRRSSRPRLPGPTPTPAGDVRQPTIPQFTAQKETTP